VDILHRVGIKSPADAVYRAITTRDGLAAWWTDKTQGESPVGGLLQFRFVDGDVDIGGFDMKVLELHPDRRVLWQVVGGPDEWIGTRVSWDIRQEGEYAIVLFKHLDWREPVEFMHHCSTKWAIFLMSLKALVETGKGAPNPVDVKIDNWN
jgi:Activator of Hsp90 ATPase homolog 1-like protein